MPPMLRCATPGGMSSAALPAETRTVKIRILVDRASVEVFANDGEIVMPDCFIPKDDNRRLKMFAAGGQARTPSRYTVSRPLGAS